MELRDSRVDDILLERQEQAFLLGEEKKEKYYQVFPALRDLDRKIQIQKADMLLELFNQAGTRSDKSGLLRLESEKKQLLQSANIPENYDKSVYACNHCEDTGIVNEELCSCYRSLLVPYLKEKGGLSDYRFLTFANFNASFFSDPEKMILIRKANESYAADFPGQKRSQLFLGNPGTGKTYMAISIANAVAEKGVVVFFTRIGGLFEIMNNYRVQMMSYSPDAALMEVLDQKKKMILEADLLVIDELGVEARGLNNTADLLDIIGQRKVKNLATVITSNLGIAELKRVYDDRLCSRLLGDFFPVVFEGKDIRLSPAYRELL